MRQKVSSSKGRVEIGITGALQGEEAMGNSEESQAFGRAGTSLGGQGTAVENTTHDTGVFEKTGRELG